MPEAIKRGLKSAAAAAVSARTGWLARQQARHALKTLWAQGGPLDESLRERARQDALDRFGSARHADWLMVYATVQGRYRDGWLPHCYYLEKVMPRVNGIAHHLARVRAVNAMLFDRSALPDLVFLSNGRCLDAGLRPLDLSAACRLLRDAGQAVVFKADHSGFGKGVRTVATADLDPDRLRGLGNGAFQRRITSHPVFATFGSEALATLRLGTVLPEQGPPELRTCYLKLGRPGHAHVLARDQLRVAVDRSSGALDATGYWSDWARIDRAPGSDLPLSDVTVPNMGGAVRLALAMHERLALPRYVCWDVAIDAQEDVWLLEWEGGVVSFAEAVQGPCFADLLPSG